MQLPRLPALIHQGVVPVGVDEAALNADFTAGLCRTIVVAGNAVGRSDFAGRAAALLGGSVPLIRIVAGFAVQNGCWFARKSSSTIAAALQRGCSQKQIHVSSCPPAWRTAYAHGFEGLETEGRGDWPIPW